MKAWEQHLGKRLWRRKVTCDRKANSEHLPAPRAQVWTSQLHPACLWHSATTRCIAPVFIGAFLRKDRSVSIFDLPVQSWIIKLTDFVNNWLAWSSAKQLKELNTHLDLNKELQDFKPAPLEDVHAKDKVIHPWRLLSLKWLLPGAGRNDTSFPTHISSGAPGMRRSWDEEWDSSIQQGKIYIYHSWVLIRIWRGKEHRVIIQTALSTWVMMRMMQSFTELCQIKLWSPCIGT